MAYSTRKKRGRPSIAEKRIEPCDRVLERRIVFAWLVPTKGPDGRGGSIDQDICDGIGQLHALGLFDGHGIDAQDMRDKGREWRNLLAKWMRRSGAKVSSYERMDGGGGSDLFYANALSDRERDRYDRMNRNLPSFERSVLLSLLVDPVVGSYPDGKENAPWVESFICEGLLKKGKHPPSWMQPFRLPDSYDRDKFEAMIRGLAILVDGALPARFERKAA